MDPHEQAKNADRLHPLGRGNLYARRGGGEIGFASQLHVGSGAVGGDLRLQIGDETRGESAFHEFGDHGVCALGERLRGKNNLLAAWLPRQAKKFRDAHDSLFFHGLSHVGNVLHLESDVLQQCAALLDPGVA